MTSNRVPRHVKRTEDVFNSMVAYSAEQGARALLTPGNIEALRRGA